MYSETKLFNLGNLRVESLEESDSLLNLLELMACEAIYLESKIAEIEDLTIHYNRTNTEGLEYQEIPHLFIPEDKHLEVRVLKHSVVETINVAIQRYRMLKNNKDADILLNIEGFLLNTETLGLSFYILNRL